MMAKKISDLRTHALFLISAIGVFFMHLMIAWRPLGRLEAFSLLYSNAPLIDDSYIFFKMSRDLVDWFSGCLPSFQLSSGFQPLIALLYCPIFHLFWNQKELSIHLALSLNALLGFLSILFLYKLLCKIVSRAVATFIISVWIWSPYVMTQTVNGMETPLALLLFLILLNYYLEIRSLNSSKTLQWFLLGIMLGIGFWARVDMGMAGLAIAIDQMWTAVQNRTSFVPRMRNLLVCGMTALAVASPWMIFTIIATDNLMPVSGKAVRQISEVFFDYAHPGHPGFILMMLEYFKKEFFMFQPLAALSYNSAWQLCCTGIWLAGLIMGFRDARCRGLLLAGFIFQVIIFAAYILIVGGFWHLNRYFYPLYTLMLLQCAVLFEYFASRFKAAQGIYHMILLVLFSGYSMWYGSQYYLFLKAEAPARYLSATLYAKDRIPAKANVGAFQSGCLSYWMDNQVINLDGVSNEAACSHLRDKTMATYLEQQRIEYIVEEEYLFSMWDSYLQGQLSECYAVIDSKKNNYLPLLWQKINIYKRRLH